MSGSESGSFSWWDEFQISSGARRIAARAIKVERLSGQFLLVPLLSWSHFRHLRSLIKWVGQSCETRQKAGISRSCMRGGEMI